MGSLVLGTPHPREGGDTNAFALVIVLWVQERQRQLSLIERGRGFGLGAYLKWPR